MDEDIVNKLLAQSNADASLMKTRGATVHKSKGPQTSSFEEFATFLDGTAPERCEEHEVVGESPQEVKDQADMHDSEEEELSKLSKEELVERVLNLQEDNRNFKQDLAESKENEDVLLKELRRMKIEVEKHFDLSMSSLGNPESAGEVDRLRALLDAAWSESRKARETHKVELRRAKERLSSETKAARSLAAERLRLSQELELTQKQLSLSRERCVDVEARLEQVEAERVKQKDVQDMQMNQLSDETKNKYLELFEKSQEESRRLKKRLEATDKQAKELFLKLQAQQAMVLRQHERHAKSAAELSRVEAVLRQLLDELSQVAKVPLDKYETVEEQSHGMVRAMKRLISELNLEKRKAAAYAQNYRVAQRKLDHTLQKNQRLNHLIFTETNTRGSMESIKQLRQHSTLKAKRMGSKTLEPLQSDYRASRSRLTRQRSGALSTILTEKLILQPSGERSKQADSLDTCDTRKTASLSEELWLKSLQKPKAKDMSGSQIHGSQCKVYK